MKYDPVCVAVKGWEIDDDIWVGIVYRKNKTTGTVDHKDRKLQDLAVECLTAVITRLSPLPTGRRESDPRCRATVALPQAKKWTGEEREVRRQWVRGREDEKT